MNNNQQEEDLNNKESSIETLNFGSNEGETGEDVEMGEEGEEEEENSVLNFNDFDENVNLDEVKNAFNVEEEVFVEETERTHTNDLLYLKELETQILATYPVTKQGLLYIQEEASREAQAMIDAKNDGLQRFRQYENGFEYPMVEDIYQQIYSNQWIIPVIIDKHKIYTLQEGSRETDAEAEEDEKKYIVESLEDEAGIKKESQVDQHALLKRMRHDANIGKISFKDMVKIFHKIQSPYVQSNDAPNVGYTTKLRQHALVLRYHDIDTVHWNTRIVKNDMYAYKDKYDEETGRVIGITPYTLVKGEDVQIVGFMVMAKNNDYDGKTIYEKSSSTEEEDKNPLTKRLILSSKITKISQVGDFIKITAPNHGLSPKTRIYIDHSNSVPNVNGLVQHMKITIENENEFSIKSTKKLSVDGTYGEIYSVNKLAYDRYKITYNEQIDDYTMAQMGSTYQSSGGEEEKMRNRLYLFDELEVKNPDDFRKILVKVVPTFNQIIESESERISQCYTFSEVDGVLSKYGIKINDLKVDQIHFVKQILKSNMEKLRLEEEITKRESLPIFHIRNKNRFEDKNFFLADLYITHVNVVKYYGHYPHLGKPEECVSARLVWLMEQRDHGIIFFSEMMKSLYGLFKEFQDMGRIQDMINEYDGHMKIAEKQLNKESVIENQMRKNKKNKKGACCELYRYQMKSFKDLEKMEDASMENGTLALVGKEIYVWDDGAKTWTLTDKVPKYHSIEYLCTFKNTDLEELDLETLDSIYHKDFGCHSKVYIRFKERLQFVSDVYQNFMNLKGYLDSDMYLHYFENQIATSIKKYYVDQVSNESGEEKAETEVEVVEPPKYDQLDQLIQKIYRLKDDDMKLNYIYQLIDKDGLLIGKDVYSKKYGRKIDPSYICGHFVYMNRAQKARSIEKKSAIMEELVNIFGDGGESSIDVHTCTNCGQFLMNDKDKYDDVEGYTEQGQQIRSRDVWTKDENEDRPQTVAELESYQQVGETLDCESVEFRKIFLEKDFSQSDIQNAKQICIFIQKNLGAKTGITLRKEDAIAVIIDSLQKIRNMLSLKDYASKEAKNLRETKGFGVNMIKRMVEEGKFENMYNEYVAITKSSIMAARFLISVQTAVPDYLFSSKLSPCVFTSFEGLDGIQYMACLLMEMKIINGATLETYMNAVNESYQELKKSTAIHQLYLKKREYKEQVSKRVAAFNTSIIENVSIEYEDPGVLPADFINMVISSKSEVDRAKYHKLWKDRIGYLNQELRKVYMKVYNETDLRDVNPESSIGVSMIEKACCDEYLDEYMGFIYYVESKSGAISFSSMIQEIRDLYKMRYLFHNRGTYHRSITTGAVSDSYFTHNDPVYITSEHTSEEMMIEKFVKYVDEGVYAGTVRTYIGNGKDRRDTKSGKLYDEILSKKYTKEEYLKLLDKIAERNSQSLNVYTYTIYQEVELKGLKKNVESLKDKEIQKLIASLGSILNKSGDKAFMDKYMDILSNLGYYQYYSTLTEEEKKQLSKKEILKNRQKLSHIRIHYIKKCYNDYLRKYLAMIKHGKSRIQELQRLEGESLLPFEESEFISRDIQSFIYQANKSIEQFYDPSIRAYFTRASLRNDAKMINSIHGEDDIYDSQHKEIIEFAKYSFQDASELLHYFFVKELNDLILCNQGSEDEEEIDEGAGEENLTMNAATMSTQCKYRLIFILFILDKIANDTEWLDLSTPDIERLNNAKHYEYLDSLQKAIEAAESDDRTGYFTRQLQYTLMGRTQAAVIPEEGEGEEIDIDNPQNAQKETVEAFMEKAKAEYLEAYGTEIPADMLETMKEDYLDKMYNAEAELENENVQDGEGEYGGVMVDADFTADELAFMGEQ